MRANYQGSEILNEFSIKIAQVLEYVCTNSASGHYLLAKNVLPWLITLTYQFPFFFFWFTPFYTGSTSQKLNSP